MAWFTKSVLIALTITVYAVLGFLFPRLWRIWLVIGLFGAILLYFLLRNPAYRYMRLAMVIVTTWCGVSGIPYLKAYIQINGNVYGRFEFGNEPGWPFNLFCGVGLVVCLLLDYFSHQEHCGIRRLSGLLKIQFAQQHQTVTGGSTAIQLANIGDNTTINVNQTELNGELDHIKSLLDKGNPEGAELNINKLNRDHGSALNCQQKFRVQAYLGKVYHDLGEFAKAAPHFRNAYDLRRDEVEGKVYSALANLLDGQLEQAHTQAADIVRKHPNSALASSIVIRSSAKDISTHGLRSGVHESLGQDPDVLCALADRYLRIEGDTVEAEALARQAHEQRTGHAYISAILATSMIDAEARSAAARAWKPPSDESIGRLREAIGLLRFALSRVTSPLFLRELKSTNALAHEMLREDTLAEADHVAALENDITCQYSTFKYASFLLRRNPLDLRKALQILQPAISEASVPEVILQFGSLSLEVGSDSDRKLAVDRLKNLSCRKAEVSSAKRDQSFRLLVLLTSALNGPQVALSTLPEFKNNLVSDIVSLEVIAILHAKQGDKAAANDAISRALEAISDATSLPQRRRIAEFLSEQERFDDVVSVLRGVVTADNFDSVGNLAFIAASKCGNDSFVLDYAKSLRQGGRWYPEILEIEIQTLHRYAEYEKAIEVAQQFLEQANEDPDTRRIRLLLSWIAIKAGRPDCIECNPARLPNIEEADPRNSQVLCAVIERGTEPARAIQTAYELVRRYYASPEAHIALCFCAGIGRSSGIRHPVPTTASEGTAIEIHIDGETNSRWIIIEDGPNPDSLRHEFAPAHPRCLEILGKAAGDKFTDGSNPYHKRIGEIKTIQCKYDFRAYDSFLRWTELFPTINFSLRFKLDQPGVERPDFTSILSVLDEDQKTEEEVFKWYSENPLSILMLSKALGQDPIQTVLSLTSRTDSPVRCCNGTGGEFDEGRTVTEAATLVIDPSAVATLFVTEIWRVITRVPFRLIMTQTTIEEFEHIVERLRRETGERLLRHGSRLVRIIIPQSQRDQQVRLYEDFITWVKSITETRGGIDLAELPNNERNQLVTLFGQAAAESMAVALAENVPLWCDDANLAAMMTDKQAKSRTWTQLVAERLTAERCITNEQFADLILSLIAFRYTHTQCSSDALLRAAVRSSWNPLQRPLQDILKWISNPNIDQLGVYGVVTGGLKLVWRNATLLHQREEVTFAIGRALYTREGGREIVASLAKFTDRMFPLEPQSADDCRRVLLKSLEEAGGNRKLIVSE